MALKKTAREMKNEANVNAILESAYSLFGEYGFQKVTMEDICAAAGVSKSTFYHLYPSKDDLMMIASGSERDHYISAHYQYDEAATLRELFHQFFLVNFEYLLQSSRERGRQIYKGYVNTGSKPMLFPNSRYVEELYRLIDRGLEEHALNPNLTREEHWRLMTDSMIGCFIGWCSHIADEPGLDEMYTRLLDALVDSLVRE